MKRAIVTIERFLIGKIRLQPFYESLHRIAVRGMNYMQSQEIHKTGELGALKYAVSKFKSRDAQRIFDVGANNGQFLIAASLVLTEQFDFFSFEPSTKAFRQLQRNLTSKNINIKVCNFGFSDINRKMNLFNSSELIGSLYPINQQDIKSEEIELRTLDSFCEEEGIDKIYYLKIDVEGAELDVLKGAVEMIRSKRIRFIQFEYGPNCMISKVFLRDFFNLLDQYQIYRILKDGLRPLKYNELLEIPLTSNFMAELISKDQSI